MGIGIEEGAGRTRTPEGAEAKFLLGALLGLTGLSAAVLGWQLGDARPLRLPGITVDRLSALLTLLVAGVGAVTFRFSLRYMDGDPRRRRFLRLLFGAVGAAYLLMLSSHLLLLFAAWFLTSLALHGLLTIYGDRPEAWRPARKKFLISRLGDLALLAAIVIIWREWGTDDLHVFLAAVPDSPAGSTAALVGLLVAVAALTKSAQFPFHSWLPETMEAPTPVSALMHAGIINAGGALLLRFAPLLVRLPEVLFVLSLVGTITAALGMVAMWAQVKVKRTLAWSTVSQMGFMMVQCGLGAFPAAVLHLVGHGCYKAWSFLRSGELPTLDSGETPRSLGQVATGTLASIPALGLAAWITGFHPLHSPGELALTAILALSFGQLWAALGRPAAAVGMSALGSLAAFGLYTATASFLAPVLGELPPPAGPLAWAAAALPVVTFALLSVLYTLLPLLGRSEAGRALRVHALHGFYFGAAADRAVDAVWSLSNPVALGESHA